MLRDRTVEQVVHIIIKDKTASLKTAEFKEMKFPVNCRKDLDQLIKLMVDRYGIEITISVNYIDRKKVHHFNNEYIRKVIYPIYKKYKRIVYRPDKLITVSVSNKDIKQDKLDRLMIQIQKARSNGNEALDDRLCKQYLKIAEL